eukprot:6137902-Ditylum_brightwellii.AAC.1
METHSHECASLTNYVNTSKDPFTTLFHNTPSPTQKFLMKYLESPKSATVEATNDWHLADLHQKPLHGLFFWEQTDVVKVDLEMSHC